MTQELNGLTVYSLSTTGKSKIWSASSSLVLNSDGHGLISIQYGYEDVLSITHNIQFFH